MQNLMIEVDTKPTVLKITPKSLCVATHTIPYSSITSMHTKNDNKFHLRITCTDSTTLTFQKQHTRDIVKNIILELKSNKQNEFDIFVSYPILLKIFDTMDISISQFLNYFKASYFYSIKNEKNCVDRFIGDFMGMSVENYASRINSASTLVLEHQSTLEVAGKNVVEKEIDFLPIYPCIEEIISKKSVEFDFMDPISYELKIELEIEEQRDKFVFEKEDLKCLKNWRGQEDKKEDVKIILEKYDESRRSLLKRII